LRIEAVTVCVDYADFLEVTLPSIRAAVDDLVVVTAPADSRTRELCRREEVRTVVTTAMHDHGRRFSLGAAVDAGLRSLPLTDWALVIDADIVLPAGTHRALRYIGLDREKLYGIDRVHCRGWPAAHKFTTEPRVVREWEVPFLREFPMGARIRQDFVSGVGDRSLAGYVPCGFFQLWNAKATGYRDYPVHPGGTAGGSDMEHALRFPRKFRELIPEIVGIQLETDGPDDPVGVNWCGRKTAEFSAEGGPYRRELG
jgi:hypothetical protein